MVPISARSRRPTKVLLSIESSSSRASSAESTGVLPRFTTYLGPTHRGRRIDFQNSPGGQIVEQLPDGRQMLFDGRLAGPGAELLDVGSDAKRCDLLELEPAIFAPVEELLHCACIGGPRVAVTDVGGEELDEAAARPFAMGAHDRRQRLQAGADECRRRY